MLAVHDRPDPEAEGEAPKLLRPGDGPYWLWYVPTLDPKAGVIGVYDHPPAAGGDIRGIPLLGGGDLALIGAARLTKLRDRIGDELEELLG